MSLVGIRQAHRNKEEEEEDIRRRRDAGEEPTQNSIAEEAFTEQKLTFMPTQPTISRLLKMVSRILKFLSTLAKRQGQNGCTQRPKKIILLGYRNALSKRFFSGDIVQQMGIKLLRGTNGKTPSKRKLTFTTPRPSAADSNRDKAHVRQRVSFCTV